MLELYAMSSDSSVKKQIEGVREVSVKPLVRRLPMPGPISSVAFGGAAWDQLYLPQNGKLFRRRIRRGGAAAWRPVKPPMPRL